MNIPKLGVGKLDNLAIFLGVFESKIFFQISETQCWCGISKVGMNLAFIETGDYQVKDDNFQKSKAKHKQFNFKAGGKMMKVSRKRKHILETIVVFLTSGIFMTFFLTNLGFASALPFFDYGDNPESYCTFSRDNGPYHINGRYEWFGEEEPDIEMDGQPTLNSDGDDKDDGFSFPTGDDKDDEDGITFLGTYNEDGTTFDPDRYWGGLIGKVEMLVKINDHDSGRYGSSDDKKLYINGWFDWTQDGDYDDSGTIPEGPNAGEFWSEHVVDLELDPSTWGQNFMTFSPTFLIGWGPEGDEIYSRWRLSYGEGTDYYGGTSFGEVEDYGPITTSYKPFVTGPEQTPEPGSMLLFGFGLVSLVGFFLKRRNKKRQ